MTSPAGRLTGALTAVRTTLGWSIIARLFHLLVDVGLVAGATWLVANAALDRAEWSWGPPAVLALLGLMKGVARYWEQYLGHHVAFGLLASLRVRFFDAIRPLVPAALSDIRSGELVDRVTADVDRVEVFYAHTLAPIVTGIAVPLLAVGGVAVAVHPIPALWLFLAMLVAGLVVPAVGKGTAGRRRTEAVAAGGRSADFLTDGIQGMSDVVGFGHGERRLAELGELSRQATGAAVAASSLDAVRSFVFDLAAGAGLVAVVWSGVDLMGEGSVTPGRLAAGLAAALVGFIPLRDVQQVKPAFDRAMEAAGRIYEVIDRRPFVEEPGRPQSMGADPGLEMSGVGFAYPGGTVALVSLDLTVEPGRKVAVVGPSGSGKSTLAALAVRLWDPANGRILVGGMPVSDLALAELRRAVTVVSQRPHLLAGSVADNLRIGRAAASPDAMVAAARAAAVHETVAALPHSYDAPVGEWGGRLSGGQRQRVALARALLADAPILILDEATSELDVDTEAEVMAGLRSVAAGKALVVIAHRLATVVDADEIVVLDEGRVVERGDHASLVEAGGLYARLWTRQLDTLP